MKGSCPGQTGMCGAKSCQDLARQSSSPCSHGGASPGHSCATLARARSFPSSPLLDLSGFCTAHLSFEKAELQFHARLPPVTCRGSS